MTTEAERVHRRELVKTCIEKLKMTHEETRRAVLAQMLKDGYHMDAYPERTFRYDMALIREQYKEHMKFLVQNGTFDYFWGTVESVKEQIKKLNGLADTADSSMARIAARNSIIQAEMILLNLVSTQNIQALEKLRLESKIIDVPAGIEADETLVRSSDSDKASDAG